MRIHRLLPVFLCLGALARSAPLSLDDCNVLWTSSSHDSSDSMPCGGGDIGLNVWVEGGDVLFYVARSGTFDENNQMLKLGRVRLTLSPNPLGTDFRQELILRDGCVKISGGGTTITVWVDVFRPVVHVDVQSTTAIEFRASYESWRDEDHVIAGEEFRANSYKVPQPTPVLTRHDTIGFASDGVRFFHRNADDTETIFDATVRIQGLDAVKAQMFDPLRHRTFGGLLHGPGLVPAGTSTGRYADTPFRAWTLRSAAPARTHAIELDLHVAQTDTLDAWLAGLDTIRRDAAAQRATAAARSRAWWAEFWDRSYIFVESSDPRTREVGRNYQRFRYQLGCNARGEFPTKFNGGLFTFDPGYVRRDHPFSPDFRLWGGGTMTAQNQRLVYHPLLKSGDYDLLQPQFDFYLRAQRNAELRSETYWHHPGACFTEQLEEFGLPNLFEWGRDRPAGYDPGMQYNPWLEYEWDTVFEFCLMMLDTGTYAGRDVTPWLPLIESCLTFFDEHYRLLARRRGVEELTQDGHYILFPGTACETFKGAYNSATTISALRVILTRLLELPPGVLPADRRACWAAMLRRVPPLPFAEFDGHRTLAPAVAWQRVQNVETPQLYPVFPWGLYGVGRPDLEVARNTYLFDPHAVKNRGYIGWNQSAIFAARLGLADEAARLTTLKLQDNDRHRFPTFWGPGYDWTPDHNWGGSGMIALQEMALQAVDDKIYLLPAWPKTWSGRFKLHAPRATVVEAVVQAGRVVDLQVTPASRRADIVLPSAD